MAFRWPNNILVAKQGEKVIGFVGYGKSDENENIAEIYALYVLAEHYNRGIGYRLTQEAMKFLKNYTSLVLWVLKDNLRVIAFYEEIGFQKDGNEKNISLETPKKAICMRYDYING